MKLHDQVPSDNIEVQFSYMLHQASISSANITAVLLTFFAVIILAMLVVVVIELKEVDLGQEKEG